MKLFKFTMAALLALCLTAVSAYCDWSEDFESYEVGTEIVGTVEGWKYFNDYAGTSTVVQDGDSKVLKLSKVEAQEANSYDMVLTPVIRLAPTDPGRQVTKISFKFKPGSKTDLFALYNVKGETIARYFYLAFNGETKEASTWPGDLKFTNLTTDYNECTITVDCLSQKITTIELNGESQNYDYSFGADITDDVVFRLSTQYESFISEDKACYYDYVKLETVSRYDQPTLVAPDTAHIGAKDKVTIYNGGPDATINYTITSDDDGWLTITPTSGELTTSKEINFRCDTTKPHGIYTANVTIDGGDAGTVTMKVIWQFYCVYETTFEEFELGNIFPQSDEWTCAYGTDGSDGSATVVSGGYAGSEKCVRIIGTGYFAPHINFTGTEDHSSTNNFRVSFMAKVEALNGWGVYFNSTDGLGEIWLTNGDDGGWKLQCQNADFATTNSCPIGEWVPVSYVLNTTIGNKKILEFQFGDCVYKDLDVTITSETEYDRFRYFRFFIWGDSTCVLMDNFSLMYEPRQSVDNKISLTGTKTYDIFATNGTMRVFNEGSIDTEVTIESPFEFLTFGGETKVVTTIPANSYTDFEISLDRSSMGNDYYVNQIKVSNDTMTIYQPVMIQSGVEGEGYTFYKSYFDTLEEGIDIREQDPAWINGYGNPPLCPITEKAGAKCLALNYNTLNALHCTIKSPTGLSLGYNYRVSFMAYVPAGWEGDYSDFWVGFQTGGTYFEQSLQGHSEGYVKFNKMDNTADLGKWFDVSYTFNTMPGNEKHLETTFDGVTATFNDDINFESKDSLNYWRFFGWCNDSSAPTYIKDVVIEAVARPDSGPQLEVARIGQVFYQDREKDVELTVVNSGTGNLSFSAEVSEGGGWLSIRAADPETGILEDTIEGTGSKKYILDIDREALGNTYGRGKVTVTGAGSTEVVDLYVQGYDDTGITFYYSDFEETPFGVINRVDPAWLHDLATVVEEDGNKCMKVQGGGGPLHAKVNVPDKLYDDFNFRVSCRVKVPGDGVPQLTFGANRRQGEYTLNCDQNEVYFTIVDSANQDAVSNTIPAGEWFDMSYTFNSDPLNRRTVSVQFGDEFYELNDPNTNPDCVDSYFEEFRFYVWDNAEPYFIDDFRIEAVGRPNVPPVMTTTLANVPVPYAADEFEVKVTNAGGNSFHFTAAPGPGVDYLNIPTDTFEVKGACRMTIGIDRSKLGYGFYRPTIRFTTDIEGQETVDVVLPIQSGTPEQGYVLYASDFGSLHTTKEESDKVVGELSEQDSCWLRCTSHNRADIVLDPAGSGKKVAKFINANDWATYTGYQLNLGVPAEAAADYDVVYSMDMYIPKTYVDRPEEEHPSSAWYVSQINGNRQCEASFWLDEEQSSLPVQIGLSDITNQEWWDEHKETATPVESDTWFRFYMRFSTQLIDFDHKNLFAVTFGENEYQMEGNDSDLTYPGGISEDQLDREDLTKLKLWSYCDEANICLDNVNILLVPKGLPEPAFLGILALLALAFARKQR